MSVRITEEVLDGARLTQEVKRPEAGAVILFEGITRNHFDGRRVQRLEYEAYTPMALREMARIVREAETRWPEARVAISHRIGVVEIGEASVVIAVSAPHRAEAYRASRFAIDTLKERVPIWKKEVYVDGSVWKANRNAEGDEG